MTLMEEQKQLSKIKDELNKNWHLVIFRIDGV